MFYWVWLVIILWTYCNNCYACVVKYMVVISLDLPSCGVCLFDPRSGDCIGTLPDSSVWSVFESMLPLWWWPVHLNRDNSGGSATCSLPRSAGMAPARLLLVRLRMWRKERLPMWEVSSPWRGTSGNDRAVTCYRRRLHETPIHWQKDTLVVQLLARMPRGSVSCALKANSTGRSVWLPLYLVALGLGDEAKAPGNSTGTKMAKDARANW